MPEHIAGKANNYDILKVIEEHFHSSQNVYPTGAAGVAVLGGAAWTLGNFVEIIPANSIESDFDIHWINIEAVTAADTYELVLYAVTTEIARVRFTVDGVPANLILPTVRVQTPVTLKNTQIQAKVMTASGTDTVTISLEYHTY